MISQQKHSLKQVEKLIHAAERLAAVQYEAGLKSGNMPTQVQNKVNKCWGEFRVAADAAINGYKNTPVIIVRWRK